MIANRGNGGGSGIYLGNDLVTTCNHLFTDGQGRRQVGRITVTFANGQASEATIVKQDPVWDLAILRIKHKPNGIPTIRWATKIPKIGDRVFSCGFGSNGRIFGNSGIIKGFGRSKNGSSGPADTMILSGRARGGDSGGPIFNANGNICGILWGSNNTEVVGTQVGRCLQFGGKWFRRPIVLQPIPAKEPAAPLPPENLTEHKHSEIIDLEKVIKDLLEIANKDHATIQNLSILVQQNTMNIQKIPQGNEDLKELHLRVVWLEKNTPVKFEIVAGRPKPKEEK